MISGDFVFSPGENTSVPWQTNNQVYLFGFQKELCESSAWALSVHNSTGLQPWPASESWSQGQQMLPGCTCALKNQPTVRTAQRAQMTWWLASLLFWIPFVWIVEICWHQCHPSVWVYQSKNKVYIFPPNNLSETVRWRTKKKQGWMARRKHTLLPSVQFLEAMSMQVDVEDGNSNIHWAYKTCWVAQAWAGLGCNDRVHYELNLAQILWK